MRFKRQAGERFFLQAADIGAAVRTHLKNGKQMVEFGLVLTVMELLGRKRSCPKFNRGCVRIQSFFRIVSELIKKQNKKQKLCLMDVGFSMVQSQFVF